MCIKKKYIYIYIYKAPKGPGPGGFPSHTLRDWASKSKLGTVGNIIPPQKKPSLPQKTDHKAGGCWLVDRFLCLSLLFWRREHL